MKHFLAVVLIAWLISGCSADSSKCKDYNGKELKVGDYIALRVHSSSNVGMVCKVLDDGSINVLYKHDNRGIVGPFDPRMYNKVEITKLCFDSKGIEIKVGDYVKSPSTGQIGMVADISFGIDGWYLRVLYKNWTTPSEFQRSEIFEKVDKPYSWPEG